MSSDTSPAVDTDAGGRTDGATLRPRLRAVAPALDREQAVLVAGSVALLAVAFRATVVVLRNLPFEPVAVPSAVREAVVTGTPLVLGLALVAVGLASTRPTVRVGFLFAGVFGVLAAVDTAVALPAVVAVVAGGVLAVVGTLGRPRTARDYRRSTLGAAFVLGIAVSLAAAVGLLGGGARDLGSVLVIGAVAATGLRSGGDRVALVAGALAFVAVAVASTANPYAAGSALLVGFAVVGAPHLLVGLAVAGGTAAAVAGLRRHEYGLPLGAGLVLLAGMPATLPRAMAVLLGATLVLVDTERLVAPSERREVAR